MNQTIKKSLLLDAETLLWFFIIYIFFVSMPSDVYAGSANSIKDTICKVANIFQGQAGRDVASLAIIIVGIGALMGKISTGLCLIVCVGIALIFGSTPIVKALTGQSQGCGCDASTATSELEQVAQRAIDMITGKIGKALATLAVMIVGLGALYGKVSWPLAVIVGLGIALIFGSLNILQQIIDPKCMG